jgi:ribosomal protein S15P/S13E
MLGLVSRRKKVLDYLRKTDYQKYLKTIQELELRK